MTNQMSKSAFARTMGVHKSQVTRWHQAGMPVLPNGSVDPEAAAEWVHRNVDPALRIHHARAQAQKRSGANAPGQPTKPMGTEHLTEHWEVVSVMFLQALAYRIPVTAASLAVASGTSLPVAYALSKAMAIAVMQDVAGLLDGADFDPPPGCDSWAEASVWNRDLMNAINWPVLAQSGGVPVDLEAWGAFTQEKFGEADTA